MSSTDASAFDELVAALRARVEQRRAEGAYPPGLEEELDDHFRRISGDRPPSPVFALDELDAAVRALEAFHFTREIPAEDSSVPGGAAVHRAVGRAVARHIQAVLDQAQQQSELTADAIERMTRVVQLLADAYDERVVQQLDDLQTEIVGLRRELNATRSEMRELASRLPANDLRPWYSDAAFTAAFRGESVDMGTRYGDLADCFAGCDPVLDIGFGRGEFLDLLRERGVTARGIEVDPQLVTDGRARGLDVYEGRAVEYLSSLADASLGGVVMLQVIEHLSPQHVLDVVKVMADKVRPGGRVVVETVNPMSMYAYTHALWIDPDHTRPVHQLFLQFLFREAGFASADIVERSPVPDADRLQPVPGKGEQAERLNLNVERANAILFAPQDYAIVATR